MSWDISIISTFKEIFAEINWLRAPVGIILFGADSEFKEQVRKKFSGNVVGLTEIGYTAVSASEGDSANTPYILRAWNNLITLSGDYSADHTRRHEAVEYLRTAGAKVLIGVYVKHKPICEDTTTHPVEAISKFNKQVNALLKNPPTVDGLNHLIVISES